MADEIIKIRELLNIVEKSMLADNATSIKVAFDIFELPQITKDIVDFLQPLISPYEMDIYWFMFRHSILETGDTLLRVSNGKLAKGIGTKFKNIEKQNFRFGEKTVTENLRFLENLGIIKKVGDTNRDGTLYKIFLPEEIEICKEKMQKHHLEHLPTVDPRKEQDYYNIKENRLKVFERDMFICYKYNKQLTRFNATLDHIQPISEGGNNSYDNLATCCFQCNTTRRATPILDFIGR
ncbi:HNH endonuclease [Larkinella punicea]|uniref:HNH endonuclease n=1 Tax=Larkinella punicea TaxID=2315727 RepID=A0A368JEP9_9BACT|nr:HNH endonuclease signature motif containing protein [Larkinella punicea]RCR66160.1 HNH endonuclease [Larkinella punicea]